MLRELHFDPRRETPASTRLGPRSPCSTFAFATPRPGAWRDHAAASARTTRQESGARAGRATGRVGRGGVEMRGAGAAERNP